MIEGIRAWCPASLELAESHVDTQFFSFSYEVVYGCSILDIHIPPYSAIRCRHIGEEPFAAAVHDIAAISVFAVLDAKACGTQWTGTFTLSRQSTVHSFITTASASAKWLGG